MTVLVETFEQLFPLYFFILLGALLRKAKIFPESMSQPLNRLVFIVFISTALFISTYDTNLAEAADLKAILFAVLAVLVLAAGGLLFAAKRIKSRARAAVIAQTAYRSNFNLHGLIYGTLLFGAARIGVTSLLIAVTVPLFNVLSVLLFAFMTGDKPTPRAILGKLATNPIIIAVILALFFQLTSWELPGLVYLPLNQIAQAAGPLALMAAGASLTFQGLKKNRSLIVTGSVMRLILAPLLLLPPALLLGFRDITLLSLLVCLGGPVASPLPPMAYEMGGDGELASQLVAVTSLFSLFTLHAFILILRFAGFL